jgi:hypothetical protein
MSKELLVYVDFDFTLHDTARFGHDLRRLIIGKTGLSVEKIVEDTPQFVADLNLGGYDYESHMRSYGLDTAMMWATLEALVTENNYLYDDSPEFIQSLCGEGYKPHILSFGEARFQAMKIAATLGRLTGDTGHQIGFDVVMRKKREHISEHHASERGVLIDDKPDQDLPDGFTEITLDRPAALETVRQQGSVYVASNLRQVTEIIRSLE